MVAAFLATMLVMILVGRVPTEPLTGAALHDARRRWREAAVRDYDYHYRMHGSTYDVRVRNGVAAEVTVDGRKPSHVDAASLTVNGLFDVLALEVENLNDPHGPFGAQRETTIARVRFNAALGYVEHYVRSAAGGGRAASIELIDFNTQAARPD